MIFEKLATEASRQLDLINAGTLKLEEIKALLMEVKKMRNLPDKSLTTSKKAAIIQQIEKHFEKKFSRIQKL